METNWIDWLVFISYNAIVFSFGIYMSRREETPLDYFLAGRRLPWYAVMLSLFATNISSGSLIGLAGDGFRYGMAVGTLEWGAILCLLMLTFIFLPYYQRHGVYTMPEFMERRYNLAVRTLFSAAVLLFEVIVNIPFIFFAGGLALEVMFGVPLVSGIIAIGVFVGVYTVFGGLSAVIWTDVLQSALMITGGIIVTVLGLHAIGGIDALFTAAADKMHVGLPADHPAYPFPATMIGGYFIISIYYWCQNQTMVQRALGARSHWDSRMGAVAACFIKLILPFILVLPGIIALVLFSDLKEADKALPLLINKVVPTGLSGLLFAAVAAALMSSADSSLNSWSTLFTIDFYHRLIDRHASPRRLILVGRLATVAVLVAVVIRAPMLRGNESILQFLLHGLAYISAPVSVIFLLGIFWRRSTPWAAFLTLLVSPVFCYFSSNLPRFIKGAGELSITSWLPIATALTALFMVAASLVTRPKPAASLEGFIWSREDTLLMNQAVFQKFQEAGDNPLPAAARYRFWMDYRLVGALAFALMVLLIWLLF